MNTETETKRRTMNGKPVYTLPVNTVLNLHSGFAEKLLSDGPSLALGEGCAYSCSFCYVPAIYQKLDRVRELLARIGKRHDEVVILREAALDVLRGQLLHPNGKQKFPRHDDHRVVYASPADDVAANMDLVRATVEACKLILAQTGWQIRLLSKSNLLPRVAGMLLDAAGRDYDADDVMTRMIFGVSTGTFDDRLAAAFEEGTPLVSKRINSLHVLQDNGFRTYAMVCPSLPFASPSSYAAFAREAEEALRYDRCEHVWAEVINLRGESFTRTLAALRGAGFEEKAMTLEHFTSDPKEWEVYNRATFEAHARICDKYLGKLRYLTYVTPSTSSWWAKNIYRGAVLLGGHALAKPDPQTDLAL
jgi:DNA repair photolyase